MNVRNVIEKVLDIAINPKVVGGLAAAMIVGFAVSHLLSVEGGIKWTLRVWLVMGFSFIMVCSGRLLPNIARKIRRIKTSAASTRAIHPVQTEGLGLKVALFGIIWGLPLLCIISNNSWLCLMGIVAIPIVSSWFSTRDPAQS